MTNKIRLVALLAATALIAACDDADHPEGSAPSEAGTPQPLQIFDITVQNLTYGQPFSPVGAVLHDGQFTPWTLGMPASAGLEQLAEGGDNSVFLNEGDAAGADATTSGRGLILPGTTETFSIFVTAGSGSHISLATMPVNTNDAFIGVRSANVGGLAVGASWTTYAPI